MHGRCSATVDALKMLLVQNDFSYLEYCSVGFSGVLFAMLVLQLERVGDTPQRCGSTSSHPLARDHRLGFYFIRGVLFLQCTPQHAPARIDTH